MPRDLAAGDFVTYTERPAWGLGEVRRVEPNGLVTAFFPTARPAYMGEFGQEELVVSNVEKAAA